MTHFLALQTAYRFRSSETSSDPDIRRPDVIYYLMHTSENIPADTLARAYRSLEYHAVQNRFVAAFQSFLRETTENDERAKSILKQSLEHFLSQRGYLRRNEKGDRLPDTPEMRFGEEGQTSYALELRLCQLLLVQHRVDHKQLYDDRLPSEYFQADNTRSNESLMRAFVIGLGNAVEPILQAARDEFTNEAGKTI